MPRSAARSNVIRFRKAPRWRRNQGLGPCDYCGGPDGWAAGAGHAVHCSRYRKPRRRVYTITRRKPRAANPRAARRNQSAPHPGRRPQGGVYAYHRDRGRVWVESINTAKGTAIVRYDAGTGTRSTARAVPLGDLDFTREWRELRRNATGTGAGTHSCGAVLHWSGDGRKWCQRCQVYVGAARGNRNPARSPRCCAEKTCPHGCSAEDPCSYCSGRSDCGTGKVWRSTRRGYVCDCRDGVVRTLAQATRHRELPEWKGPDGRYYRHDSTIKSRRGNHRGRRTRGRRSNPARQVSKGARVLIYPEGRVVGTWYGRHRNGGLYRHRFTHRAAAIYGNADGSITIRAHRGRLWAMFR